MDPADLVARILENAGSVELTVRSAQARTARHISISKSTKATKETAEKEALQGTRYVSDRLSFY